VEVTIGKRNQVYVEVLDGVKEGDEVLMTPPELTDGEES
jgi:multidrug efflux pump subunit AcrA (membrane-fusion protein)